MAAESSINTDLGHEQTASGSDTDGFDACSAGSGSVSSTWTEDTNVPKRRMGVLQVVSLMINQMIGSGIFITPGNVLLITGSKPISIALWAIGGIYQCLGAVMYLEYSSALPFTGGPLIWLDETLHKPKMLAAFVFSWYWVLFATSGSSCLTVAQYLLALAWQGRTFDHFDDGMIRYTAVVVLTAACLSVYFVRRICFLFNGAFAVMKIVFALVLFVCGMKYAFSHKSESGIDQFANRESSSGGVRALSSIIYINYAYQGWEHTNFIAGEIYRPARTLTLGVYVTLSVVTCLYIMVASCFYAAVPYEVLLRPDPGKQTGIAFVFAERVFGSTKAMTTIAALSAWSSLVANVYANARVKQAIAWQRILPFSAFIGRQDRQFNSPGGALFLHWFVSMISIAVKPYFNPRSKFYGKVYDYVYYFEMGILVIALPCLGKRMLARKKSWKPLFIRSRMILYPYCILVGGFSFMVISVTAIPNSTRGVPNYYLPATLAAISLSACIHWAVLQSLRMNWGRELSLGQRIGFEVKVYGHEEDEPSESHRSLMKDANRDGSRRRIEYSLNGRPRILYEKIVDVALFVARKLE